MNTRHDRCPPARFPTEVHDVSHVPVPDRARPRGIPPPGGGSARPRAFSARYPGWRTGVACLLLAAGICAVLVPALRSVGSSAGAGAGSDSGHNWGQLLGGGLLQGGLPPTHTLAAGTDSPAGTEPGEWTTSFTYPTEPETESEAEADPGGSTDTSDAEPPVEPATDFEGDGTETQRDPVDGVATGESWEGTTREPAGEDGGSGSGFETEDEHATMAPPVTVPAGCYPLASEDRSMTEYGVGHVVGDAALLPERLPTGGLWGTRVTPAVLVVHTHPYEGYSDGGDWYDPATGGLAQTSSPHAPDGVVALGAELVRTLQGSGIKVIHVRIAVSEGDSSSDIYARTETVARYYCRLYPDIGLVLNLRRSAELTEKGAVLRTEGHYGGEPGAQLRISVYSGRSETELGADLAAALTLRAGLWEVHPSVSRPVCVKEGTGFGAELEGVRILTLEMGSAGNTFLGAGRLIAPLAMTLAGMILN